MITTDFVPGSPCWLDLGAPDVEVAAAFYRAVFGWRAEPYGDQGAGGYTLFRLDGKVAAAAGPLPADRARSAWTLYFHTPDADETVKTVEQAGGAVLSPPADVGADDGRFARLADPQGAEFAVWQPQRYPGFETADGAGSLGWTELYTTDAAAAQTFYKTVFGWGTQDMPLPGGGGTYTLLRPANCSDERMHGGLMGVPTDLLGPAGKPYWHPVFGSRDCDATVGLVTGNGGTLSMGPETAEGVGRLAVCNDPSGAEFVILTPQAAL
ncbi:VOC family protein [Streptomyces lydicus]|uniref:VOC family protein n=1 Tax=Streptomyces lydicus TaxID=47763 RepID=UPI0005244880|nr:VOC family protein [Streptomyces lydicus]MDC7336415.1 VOC family protein [Streptomyces lydicus]UEG94261.1 VOC family protein [Streptomyces lydicus]